VWKNAALHIDGKVDLDGAALTCTTCHGTVATGNPAPPRGTSGELTTAQRAVGAHAQHLGASTWHRDGQCADCHTLPASTNHSNGVTDFTWGVVSTAKASLPSYSPVTATCSDVYCHGGKLLGPAAGGVVSRSPVWNVVNGSYDACGTTCHTNPPGGKHPQQTACPSCHGDVIATYNPATTASTWKDRALHVNGKVEVAGCGGCHAVPPKTGAHVKHYGDAHDPPLAAYGDLRTVTDYAPGGSPAYIFGCGNCHPIDPAHHADGVVDVDLSPAGAPAGSLKAKNAALASYAGGACSGVYCHSSGQEAPAYVASPPWNGAFAGPRCAACHTNPPAYPSGGAGSATANTHLVMADDGIELGHFGGMPGAWHTSYHGNGVQGAAPITCQTCHYLTVDPANVGPGGFYYLDTEGQYNLGGQLNYACATCHTGAVGAPAVKTGAVLTAKHVNGVRDVAFDPRAAIAAAVGGLPAGADRPTYPYWVKAQPSILPPRSVQNGTSWSLELSGSTYDPATKTCGSVPCHLKQSFGAGAPGFVPLRWGLTPVGNATCNDCHGF
jgi:predicted CxxxxCH...CXXCH cytochrome family protein